MPKITVVIPTYNRAQLIDDTLHSVLAQTYRDFEVIVIDDGSTDETARVVASYGSRVVYYRQENGGQASACNFGITLARGEYVAFLDSDDLWLPYKLERQMALLATQNYAWAYCDVALFDGQTGQDQGVYSQKSYAPHQGQVAQQLILGNFIASPSVIVRRDVFTLLGGFDQTPELKSREDWEMWLRIAAHHAVAYVPAILARYRQHVGSITHQEDIGDIHRGHLLAIEHAVHFAPDIYGPLLNRALAAEYVRAGRARAGRGQLLEARRMFTDAIRYDRRNWQVYVFWATTFLDNGLVKQMVSLNRRRHGRLATDKALK